MYSSIFAIKYIEKTLIITSGGKGIKFTKLLSWESGLLNTGLHLTMTLLTCSGSYILLIDAFRLPAFVQDGKIMANMAICIKFRAHSHCLKLSSILRQIPHPPCSQVYLLPSVWT